MMEKRRSLDVQNVKNLGCRVRLLLRHGCPFEGGVLRRERASRLLLKRRRRQPHIRERRMGGERSHLDSGRVGAG